MENTKYAFPNTTVNANGIIISNQTGMTLRQHYAGLAMQIILKAKLDKEMTMTKDSFECHIVKQSYDLADSMLGVNENDLIDTISGLVSDISTLLSENDIEWQQAGYFNHAKELLSSYKK